MNDIPNIKKIGPFLEGIKALESNAPFTSCPYAFDTCAGDLWVKGYHYADKCKQVFDKQDKYKMRKPLNNVIVAMCKGETSCT